MCLYDVKNFKKHDIVQTPCSHTDISILLICGVFARENEAEVVATSKRAVEFSANQTQLKLIDGLKSLFDTRVISAPFIGAYPNRGSMIRFSGFSNLQDMCEYVCFNNIWGYRNISRAHALKKAVRSFVREKRGNKMIVVYSTHDPFLSAAVYAKRLDPSIKICLFAADLPQYMNLEANRGVAYDFFKKIDIKSIQKHIKSIDTSVLLTEPMAHALCVDDRPYIVAEGVVDRIDAPSSAEPSKTKNIVYAGKLYERFGVKTLIDAFRKIKDVDCRLILCGTGDAFDYAKKHAALDPRIILTGQISPNDVKSYLSGASVLVNPRPNNEEYTKYSFPSKNIEYLMSAKPTVAYMLDGMPSVYKDFLFAIDPDVEPTSALAASLTRALEASEEEIKARYTKFISYAEEQLTVASIVRRIVSLTFGKEV